MNRRRNLLILLLLLILVFFFTASQAIVKVKVQELRFQLSKEQLLNYELSSRVLKEKIKQMRLDKENFTNEIKMNVLESGVMNAQLGEADTKLSYLEKFGLVIVNGFRLISMKNLIHLEEDQNNMMKIQFGFYMERTRKFAIASKKYTELEKSLTDTHSNEYGFIMLHNGFCIAMTGDTEGAIKKLRETEAQFPGTHFADNARILIIVLLEGQKKLEQIAKASTEEKAEIFFDTGQYKETLATLNQVENRDSNQNYMRARSLEELGQTNTAISEYLALVEKKGENSEIAKKANRRLLLLGTMYEKNDKLAEFSKSNAEQMGDTEAVKKVEAGSSLVLKSLIVEKLTEEKKDGTPKSEEDSLKIDEAELTELKKELETVVLTEKKERAEKKELAFIAEPDPVPAKVEEPPPVEEKKDVPKKVDFKLRVELVDGRYLSGKTLDMQNESAEISFEGFAIKLPMTLINEVTPKPEPGNGEAAPVRLQLTDGKVINCYSIRRSGGDIFSVKTAKEETSMDGNTIKKIFVSP